MSILDGARLRPSRAGKRRVTIQTPLGEALQFHRLAGREALSQAYAFDLDLLGSSNAIDPKALLGKPATVVMETESGAPRYLAGLITRFGLSHEDDRQAFYKMRLRPWLWLATRRSDFRIFQDQSVPEIIAAVLGRYGHPMEQKLSRSYRPWRSRPPRQEVRNLMSTAKLFLDPEEIEEFIRESKVAPQWFYGDKGRELGICPYVTFYVYHQPEDYMSVANKFIDIWECFEQIMDNPFERVFKSRTQVWLKAGDKRLPTDLRAEAKHHQEEFETFYLMATDMESPDASPLWSYSARVDHVPQQCYSTLKLIFCYDWYQDGNETRWSDFVLDCIKSVRPEQAYMGYEVGNGDLGVMGSYESDVLERICADYFYGLDIDHPSKMGYQYHDKIHEGFVNPTDLGAGLRPPTWCFMLSPVWQRKLGKPEHQIRVELADPRIKITSVPYPRDKLNPDGANGLWIELGDLDLYPVEDGVPDVLAKANRLIRPIRCDELNLNTLDPWDGDPNPRFGYESSLRWMRRFDDDSDWPSAEQRRKPSPDEGRTATSKRKPLIPGGEPCPQAGWWFTPAQLDSRRYFEKGEIMPIIKRSSFGDTNWQQTSDPKDDK